MPWQRSAHLLLGALVATALAGCATPQPAAVPGRSVASPQASARATPASGGAPSASGSVAVSARAVGRSLLVHAAPDGPVTRTLANPQPAGAPLTLLVKRAEGPWLEVFLPMRPNGSTGWVRARDVRTAQVPYRVEISTAAHRLELYKSGRLVATFAAATGTGGTPTPVGSFFLTELLAPTNPGYGPYAYGLSAFSDVLTSFGGGPGQIGLHGTSEAGSIGHSSSHGCIRLSNADITTLAKILPLGTPVNIT